MKRVLETFVLGLVLILNSIISGYVAEILPAGPDNKIMSEGISGFVSVLIFFVYLINQNGLRKFRFFRRNFLTPLPAKYEGYWIASVKRRGEEDTPDTFSISKIYYDRIRKSWFHQGFEFDGNGHCTGEWKVESINFSMRRGLWFFRGSTWQHKKRRQKYTLKNLPKPTNCLLFP